MSLGRHTTFKRYDAASSEADKMEVLGDVMDMPGVDMSADTIEATPYGGDQGDWRTYEAGLKDGGELTVSTRYKTGNAQAEAMVDAFFNGTQEKIQLVLPAAIGEKFEADVLVTKVGIPTGKGDKINRDFTLKISGEPTLSAV